MSLKAAFLTALAAVSAILFLVLSNSSQETKDKGSVTASGMGETVKTAEATAALNQVPVQLPKSPLEIAEQEFADAKLALLKLSQEQPEALSRYEESEQKFKVSQSSLAHAFDQPIADLDHAIQTPLPELSLSLLHDLNVRYGTRVWKLTQEVAQKSSKGPGDFVYTNVVADLMNYVTRDAAENGSYDAVVRKSYPYQLRHVYFTNIDPAFGRYFEANQLESILGEYLDAVKVFDANRRKADVEFKSAAARRRTELLEQVAEISRKEFTPPSDLSELGKLYTQINMRIENAKLIIDQLNKANLEAAQELQRQEAAKLQAQKDEEERWQNNPMHRWTSSATGSAWLSASETERRALCQSLASRSTHGCSEQYFYDAYEAFYGDGSMNSENVLTMGRLFEAGSSTIPKDRRSY
jgi:hypothetical protein